MVHGYHTCAKLATSLELLMKLARSMMFIDALNSMCSESQVSEAVLIYYRLSPLKLLFIHERVPQRRASSTADDLHVDRVFCIS